MLLSGSLVHSFVAGLLSAAATEAFIYVNKSPSKKAASPVWENRH